MVTAQIPDFVRRYPSLVVGGTVPDGVAGWRISIAPFGVPLLFEPLEAVPEGNAPGEATVVAVDPEQLQQFACRNQVDVRGDGSASIGRGGRQLLELLFGFH